MSRLGSNDRMISPRQRGIICASSTGFLDTFDRADDPLSLGTATTGQAWSNLVNVCGISANAAQGITPAVLNQAKVDAGLANGTITSPVTLSPVKANIGICFHVIDANNFLLLSIRNNGGNAFEIYKIVGGAGTLLGGTSAAGNVLGATYTLTVTISGANITALRDGVSLASCVLSGPDQTLFGAITSIGIYYDRAGVTGDDGQSRLNSLAMA